eukprot:4186673-Prymnesium_polylepis.1
MACRHPHWVQGRAAPASIVRRCGGGQHGGTKALAVEVLHLRPVGRRRRGVAPATRARQSAVHATDGRAGTRGQWRGVAAHRVLPVVPGRYELRFTTYRPRTSH